ncbi:MAG: flippase-like domain-containing protein [Acidimicrobiia bacterium]|nr:flippase-like domain-containing protein [Acidimicrobiia bacterium]
MPDGGLGSAWRWARSALVRRRDEADDIFRRRPGDLVRVVLAAAGVALLTWHAYHLTATERALAQLIRSLPSGARSLLHLLYEAATLWALAVAVVAVAAFGRWRLARDVAIAGATAWVLGRVLAFTVHQTDLDGAFRVLFDPRNAPPFPTVRVGMAVAMIAVAGPYFTRPVRRVGQGLVLVLALTALYLGRGLVTDDLAAVVLGWGTAAAVHFAFGTPLGRPTMHQVEQALAHLGVAATGLRLAQNQPVGRAVMLGSGPGGPVRVIALGRDEANAQFLARAWRYIAYRDAPANLSATRRGQVEYEAYVMLLAARAGVSVPDVIAAADVGQVAVLVVAEPAGTSIADLVRRRGGYDGGPDDDLGPAALECVWAQAARLARTRIAHGRPDARHLIVIGEHEAVTLIEWDRAVASATDHQIAKDVAQLLATSAAVAGDDRAVTVATAALEPPLLEAALPWLQASVLGAATRDALDRDRNEDTGGGADARLEQLRQRTAATLGIEPPKLRPLTRVNPRQVLMALGALVGVGVLLSRVGDPAVFWRSISQASWGYVVVAFVAGMMADIGFAVAFMGTVPIRLPLWPTVELQWSLAFANLAVPVAADAAMQVRFLQKNGLQLSEAVATGGLLSSISELIVQGGLFAVALLLAPSVIHFGRVDTTQIVVVVLIVIFVVGVGAALAFGVRSLRRAVMPPVARAGRAVWDAVKTPGRIGMIIAGNVAAYFLYAAALLACLAAFGHPVNFWTLIALNIGISLIASLVPFPGGATAVSAIGLSGMLVTLGVPTAAATGAVLSQKIVISYLPAIPGWFASNDLAHQGLL